MSTNKKQNRWLLLAVHLGTVIFMAACAAFGTATQTTNDGSIQVEDGTIEVKNEDGDWDPVAGESAFELVGDLESIDPWIVAGTTLETNESTQIEDGLETGDLVRVLGTVLEDGTWLAYSIKLAEEQTDPIIVLIGVVDSVDPWSVNGISLNVTDETDIQGDIAPGMIVRVEILLLEDGTWEVLSIAPLGESTETTGCVTVVATIISVEGNEIQFLGWPTTVTLNVDDENNQGNEEDNQGEDEGNENTNVEITLEAGQVVQAVVCISDDGQLIIVQIILLDNDEVANDGAGNGEKVLICHKPDKKGGHTLSVASPAVPAHLAHGDKLGACP
ncbi:MAG TPA: DUF5666 domain-containing protein [Anaerolineales bacterium]|nr:DUF5666 domain-containing protein [Anaerolineales bacterium]